MTPIVDVEVPGSLKYNAGRLSRLLPTCPLDYQVTIVEILVVTLESTTSIMCQCSIAMPTKAHLYSSYKEQYPCLCQHDWCTPVFQQDKILHHTQICRPQNLHQTVFLSNAFCSFAPIYPIKWELPPSPMIDKPS